MYTPAHPQEALLLAIYHDPARPLTAALAARFSLHLAARPWLGKNLVLLLVPSGDGA